MTYPSDNLEKTATFISGLVVGVIARNALSTNFIMSLKAFVGQSIRK